MKKQIMLLAVLAAVLTVLCIAVWKLSDYTPHGQVSDTAAGAAIKLFDPSNGQLQRLEISNSGGDFTVNAGAENFGIDGFPQGVLSDDRIQTFLQEVQGLAATVLPENSAQLSDYGLDKPKIMITAEYVTGEKTTVRLGNKAPTGGGCYGSISGDNAVYILPDGWQLLLSQPLDFADTTVIDVAGADGKVAVPQQIILGGSLRPQQIVMIMPEGDDKNATGFLYYNMTEPQKRKVDSDDVVSVLTQLMSIEADKAVGYVTDASELCKYNLDNPYSTAAVTWDNADGGKSTCKISVSKPADGLVYLICDKSNLIYSISQDNLPWLELQYEDLISRMPLLPFIFDVKTVTVRGGEVTASYQLEKSGEDIIVTAEGKALDSKRFKQLYRCLIDIPAEQYTKNPPKETANSLLTVTYSYNDGRPDDCVQLIEENPMQCYLWVNGQAEFLTKSRYAEIILQNIENLAKGKEILPLY